MGDRTHSVVSEPEPIARILSSTLRQATTRIGQVSAGIAMVVGGDVVFASTDERARELNRLQFTMPGGAGPRSMRLGKPIGHDRSRAGELVEREHELGVTDRLAVPVCPVIDGDRSRAVLTLWTSADRLDHSVAGEIATDIAAIVGQTSALVAHLRRAKHAEAELRAADPVPIAQGVLMERDGLTGAEAAEVLAQRARRARRSPVDVAEDVIVGACQEPSTFADP